MTGKTGVGSGGGSASKPSVIPVPDSPQSGESLAKHNLTPQEFWKEIKRFSKIVADTLADPQDLADGWLATA